MLARRMLGLGSMMFVCAALIGGCDGGTVVATDGGPTQCYALCGFAGTCSSARRVDAMQGPSGLTCPTGYALEGTCTASACLPLEDGGAYMEPVCYALCGLGSTCSSARRAPPTAGASGLECPSGYALAGTCESAPCLPPDAGGM